MSRSFNTNTDSITWGGGPLLYNVTDAAIGCWFKHSTVTNGNGFNILIDQYGAFNKRVFIAIGDGTSGSAQGKFLCTWRTPTANSSFNGASAWDDGNWHRLLYVRRNASPFTELYIDGVSDGSSTTDPTTDATVVTAQFWGQNANPGAGGTDSWGVNGNGSLARGFIVLASIGPNEGSHVLWTGQSPRHLEQLYEMGIGSPDPDWSGNQLSGTLNGTAIDSNGPWTFGALRQPQTQFSPMIQTADEYLFTGGNIWPDSSVVTVFA